MDPNVLAILIVGTCMFIPLWLGAKAGEHGIQTPEDFFIQSRTMNSVIAFFTIEATWWSAFAFFGASGYYYESGPVYWTTIAWDFLFGILFFLIGKRVWLYGKKNNYITASDFFRDFYGSEVLANLVALTMLIFTLPYLQIQLTSGAYLIESASGGLIPWQMGGLVFSVVIVIYVWTGGLRAVAWTDIFYEVLIITGTILSGILIVSKVHGVTELFKTLKETAPEMLTLPGPKGQDGAMAWISMFIMVPTGAIMGPQMWTRMYAVKSPKIFELLPLLCGFAAIINLFPMLIGNAGILLEPGLAKADTLLPVLVFKYVPFAVASFIIVAGAAAPMSTSNSQIHSISAVYTMDIHQRYINKNLDNRALTRIGRLAIVAFAIISYFLSICVSGLVIQIGLVALSGTAQIIVPTIGALFWKRSTAQGAVAGLATGILSLFLFTLVPAINLPYNMHAGLAALLLNAMIFMIISSITLQEKPSILKKRQEQNESFI